jgi:hypothetical protein
MLDGTQESQFLIFLKLKWSSLYRCSQMYVGIPGVHRGADGRPRTENKYAQFRSSIKYASSHTASRKQQTVFGIKQHQAPSQDVPANGRIKNSLMGADELSDN